MNPSQPGKTLYRKLVDAHTVVPLDADNVLLYADLHLMNEYTSPQAFAGLHERGLQTLYPGQNVATVSHIIPTHADKLRIIADGDSALQASNLKRNCERHGIPLFDTNDRFQGIEHVIAPEHGMIRPMLPLQRLLTLEHLTAVATHFKLADVSALYAAIGENTVGAQFGLVLQGLTSPEDGLATARHQLMTYANTESPLA